MKIKFDKNTLKYIDMVFDESKKHYDLNNIKTKKQLGKAFWNIILDKNDPRKVSKKPNKKRSFFANKIFRPLSEILKSLEVIENISVYIRSFPYKRQGISKESFLRYHIENYLNELYILKLRLERYLKILSRAYKRTKRNDAINKAVESLSSFVQKSFEGYKTTRGYHVHQHRYTDNDLDRLTTLFLFSRSKEKWGNTVRLLFKLTYRDIRRKWLKKIESDIKGIQKLLEIYFEALIPVISENGKIIYPFH